MRFFGRGDALPTAETALPGSADPVVIDGVHVVLGTSMVPPWPTGLETAVFGMGCFWGVERLFWRLPGVWTTAVGYAGGFTANPSYQQVCTGRTGHTEAVLVVHDPDAVSFGRLLRVFWEDHDPTQGMRQHHDRGSQYRSAVYCTSAEQLEQAAASRDDYRRSLSAAGFSDITTEIAPLAAFYYAEDYHQQYLDKNPRGYCDMRGTGIACSVNPEGGLGVAAQ